MPTFYDLLKFAATGIAAPDMTAYDKMRALAAFGGGKAQTLTGQPPLSFHANGTPLISWSMKGNGSQTGTPTPDAPIMPDFCGTLDGTDWTIPLTCAGQTVPVYLGEVPTVRRVKKMVLTGKEQFFRDKERADSWRFYSEALISAINNVSICSHFAYIGTSGVNNSDTTGFSLFSAEQFGCRCPKAIANTITEFKAWLASQYAAGTPVTVWYVLSTPETGIINEPLCKIGDYADELHSTDAAVTIPTVKGDNTLTVDTDLQPSEMTITYKG